MNIRGVVNAIYKGGIKHAPDILTGLGLVGLVASGIMAVRETPKAYEVLKAHEAEIDGTLTTSEKVADCWKFYAPSVGLAGLSILSIIFARRIDSKRVAALAAAYQMSENALVRMRDSVRDEVGENKLKKIEDNADLKLMEENPVIPDDIIETGDGNDLFMDYYSRKYFRSSPDKICTRYNKFISRLNREDYLTPNDWISALELPTICEELGDYKYFTSSMYQTGKLDDRPVFIYGPGYLGSPCAIVKLSAEPSLDRYS